MNLQLNLAARIALNLVALLGGVLVLRLGAPIFLPLIFAVLLATILWPSANRLNSFYRLPWPVACLTAVGGLVLFNLLVLSGFVLAVPKLLQNVANPDAQRAFYTRLREQVTSLSPFPISDDYLPAEPEKSVLYGSIRRTVEGDYALQVLFSAVNFVSSYLWQFILVFFILLFLLMEGRMLTRRVVEVFGPSKETQGQVGSALLSMATVVRDFIIWRTVINIGLALVVGLVYQALGLRQAWLWALMTMVLCYIPYIGPIVAAGPPLLDALIHTSGWTALVVLLFFTGIITLEGYVIVPLLMGRHMDLNATTVMLACLFWDLVWGVPGLFLALPLMGAIKAICEHVPGWQPWANLMSARDPGKPAAVPTIPPGDPDKTLVITPPPVPTGEFRAG